MSKTPKVQKAGAPTKAPNAQSRGINLPHPATPQWPIAVTWEAGVQYLVFRQVHGPSDIHFVRMDIQAAKTLHGFIGRLLEQSEPV